MDAFVADLLASEKAATKAANKAKANTKPPATDELDSDDEEALALAEMNGDGAGDDNDEGDDEEDGDAFSYADLGEDDDEDDIEDNGEEFNYHMFDDAGSDESDVNDDVFSKRSTGKGSRNPPGKEAAVVPRSSAFADAEEFAQLLEKSGTAENAKHKAWTEKKVRGGNSSGSFQKRPHTGGSGGSGRGKRRKR